MSAREPAQTSVGTMCDLDREREREERPPHDEMGAAVRPPGPEDGEDQETGEATDGAAVILSLMFVFLFQV